MLYKYELEVATDYGIDWLEREIKKYTNKGWRLISAAPVPNISSNGNPCLYREPKMYLFFERELNHSDIKVNDVSYEKIHEALMELVNMIDNTKPNIDRADKLANVINKALEERVIREKNKGKWLGGLKTIISYDGQILHEVVCSKCHGISYFRTCFHEYVGAKYCPCCGELMSPNMAAEVYNRFNMPKQETEVRVTKELEDVILAKCDEREQKGYDHLSDSDVMDILEECEQKNIPVTRKDIER